VRWLLQRREQAGPDDRVTAHLDLACADIPAMADPAGRPYCLTGRVPGS
jgi:hypothetical protein